MTVPPGAVEVPTILGPLLVHADDEVMTPWLREYGSWEADESALLRSVVRAGELVVDVGANVGYTTILLAALAGARGRVVAVEPHPANVRLLRANIERHGLRDRVDVVAAAAWDDAGSVDLAECATNAGDHRVGLVLDGRAHIQVPAIRLDDLVFDQRVALVKLDTQATEHRALGGAQRLLARDRPLVLAELWPEGLVEAGADPRSVLASHRALGYDVDLPDAPALGPRPSDEAILDDVRGRATRFATVRLTPVAPR